MSGYGRGGGSPYLEHDSGGWERWLIRFWRSRKEEEGGVSHSPENWEAGVGCGVGNGKVEFPAWRFSLAGLQRVGREMPGSGAQTCMGARD